MLARSMLATRLSSIARRHTRASGMFVAGCKGAAADCLSQAMLQGADSSSYDPGRTLVFGVWSGGYCGGVLYLLYNRLFPRIFPVTNAAGMVHPRRIPHAIAMVAFDNFVHYTFIYFPIFYIFKELIQGQPNNDMGTTVSNALAKYKTNCVEDNLKMWMLWIPV